MIITKELSFEAAHMLSNYEGKCANLHGHSYQVRVAVVGDIDPETGMLVDYNYIKNYFDRYDHAIIFGGEKVRNQAERELYHWACNNNMRHLNMPDCMLPTAENMAYVAATDLLACLKEEGFKHVRDVNIEINETKSSSAHTV